MMTNINPELNETETKRYLYGEMTDAERERFEEKLFDDGGDELFFSVVNLENELVDLYARGKFSADELFRFENSLKNLPERQLKIANAAALQSFIAEEKNWGKSAAKSEKRIYEKSLANDKTFGQRMAEFFTVKTPAFGYAITGLMFFLAATSVFLFVDGRRKDIELARLQENREVSPEKQSELERQLANRQKRENELNAQIDGERETSGDLSDELERERQKRGRIENELEQARLQSNPVRPSSSPTTQPESPLIASVFLTPTIATRGGGSSEAKKISVAPDTKRILVRLSLPADVKLDERFSVRLNDKIVTNNLAARLEASGKKTIQITVSPEDLPDGLNKLIVADAAEKEIGRYDFVRQTF